MFKVGVLYRIQEFLEYIRDTPLSPEEFQDNFPTFDLILSSEILSISSTCGWASISPSTPIKLTSSGLGIVQQTDTKLKLRLQLGKLIQLTSPSWLGLLQRGRKAILHFANPDTVQCFKDAGLLDEADPEVAKWWDSFITPSRVTDEARLLEIGRKGEWLSIKHEEKRVGCKPVWVALDSNSAGYDLLSIVSKNNNENLVIEVKASEKSVDKAEFYLTRNEWNTLTATRHAIVHLWSLATKKPVLSHMTIDVLAKQIPNDKGNGTWQIVRIPFVAS